MADKANQVPKSIRAKASGQVSQNSKGKRRQKKPHTPQPKIAPIELLIFEQPETRALVQRLKNLKKIEGEKRPSPYPLSATFLDLLLLYRVNTPTKIENRMVQAIDDNRVDVWLVAYLILVRRTEKAWKKSTAYKTYKRCRERLQDETIPPEERTPPTVKEAATIMRPLLAAVQKTRPTQVDAAKACAQAWLAFPDCGGRDFNQLELLLCRAKRHPIAWDAAHRIYDTLVDKDEAVPPKLSAWMVDRYRDNKTRPTLGRGSPPKSFRSFVVRQAIEALVNLGMKATRNPEGKPTSACDAVAQAMGIKFETVRRRWRETRGIETNELAGLQESLGWIWEEFDRSVPYNPTLFLMFEFYANGYMASQEGNSPHS